MKRKRFSEEQIIAELPGELQQPHFGANDFLVLGHGGVFSKQPGPGAA
jgi:hypothetical protein